VKPKKQFEHQANPKKAAKKAEKQKALEEAKKLEDARLKEEQE
jgi:hypothetical protein